MEYSEKFYKKQDAEHIRRMAERIAKLEDEVARAKEQNKCVEIQRDGAVKRGIMVLESYHASQAELAVAKDSADKWFTKCRTVEANNARLRSANEELDRQYAKTDSKAMILAYDNARLRACLNRLYNHAMDHYVFCPCSHGSIKELRNAVDEAAKELKEGE